MLLRLISPRDDRLVEWSRYLAVSLAVGFALITLKVGQTGAVAVPAVQANAQANANVTGRVIAAVSGKPVVGAKVELRRVGAAAPLAASQEIAATGPTEVRVTGSGGSFVFERVALGSYRLSVVARGYLVGEYGRISSIVGEPLAIDTADRQVAVTIRLSMPAAISGRVEDERSAPAVGVPVRLLNLIFQHGRRVVKVNSETTTDDRGEYRFGSLQPGDFIVTVPLAPYTVSQETIRFIAQTFNEGLEATRALARRFEESGLRRPMGKGVKVGRFYLEPFGTFGTGAMVDPGSAKLQAIYGSTYYGNASSVDEATPLSVRSGEDRSGVDLRLSPRESTTVSGTISTSEGPVAHQSLVLVSDSPLGSSAVGFDVAIASALSEPNGNFTFLGVPQGRYLLRALRNLEGREGPEFAELPIDSTAGPVNDLKVKMMPGNNVQGRVRLEQDGARDARVLEETFVALQPVSGPLRDSLSAVRPNADGEFRTRTHPPGRYILSVSPSSGWSVKTISIDGVDGTDAAFELGAKDLTAATVTLTNRLTNLVCRVENPSPVTSVVVVAFPSAYEQWMAAGFADRRLRVAAAEGQQQVMMRNLPAGQYLVAAVSGEVASLQAPDEIRRLARVATRVVLAEGGTTTVTLRPVSR